MTIDFELVDNAREFVFDFGEVREATDGGYERGYAAGHTDGVKEGYSAGYGDGVASVPEKRVILQDVEITENGEYSADDGYDGLGRVTVNVTGSTNAEAEEIASLLGNTMTVLDNSLVTSLRTRACQGATKLVSVNLPNVTSLGSYAFYQCSGLVTCKLPKLTSVSTQTWYGCTNLKHADCGNLDNITAQTFNACSSLTELILRKTDSICTLSNANGVSNSAIGKGTGHIYVPAASIEEYKASDQWSTFADQFRAIEDYPDICGE